MRRARLSARERVSARGRRRQRRRRISRITETMRPMATRLARDRHEIPDDAVQRDGRASPGQARRCRSPAAGARVQRDSVPGWRRATVRCQPRRSRRPAKAPRPVRARGTRSRRRRLSRTQSWMGRRVGASVGRSTRSGSASSGAESAVAMPNSAHSVSRCNGEKGTSAGMGRIHTGAPIVSAISAKRRKRPAFAHTA